MDAPGTKRIDSDLSVSDIVNADYRTADVFRKYGIEFCCGGKWPLRTVCNIKNIDIETMKKDLEESIRTVCLPNTLNVEEWDVDFLTDYIINVHHQYLKKTLLKTKDCLERFAKSHDSKFLYLPELLKVFIELFDEIIPHLQQEEDIIFPYIKQIAHAYQNRESYAGLLVRTLRKPVENVMNHENEYLSRLLGRIRVLTDHYTLPANTCVSHRVVFSTLLEIDNDLVQHLHLENDILFPKAIAMEKELLKQEK